MEFTITLLDLDEQPTVSMRETHPVEALPAFFGKAYGAVMAYLQDADEQPAGMPFGVYYNLEMSALDIEAGFPVSKALPGNDMVKGSTIPGGHYVSTVFKGAYNKMKPAYDALENWAVENGWQPTSIAYEFYLNDPNEAEGIVAETEIRFPVRKI